MQTSPRTSAWIAALPLLLASAGTSLAASADASAQDAPVARPVSASESSSDDAEFQARLASLREKYNQDRQALKARSSQLPPDERLRLHKALLDSHQQALTRLEQDAKTRSSNPKARWEQRRDERSERLEEVRKDGTARKRRHDKENR